MVFFYFVSLPPRVGCPSSQTLSTATGMCGNNVTFGAVTAVDNCGVSSTQRTAGLANNSFFGVGTTLVNYTSVDAAGGSSTCSFQVAITDNEAPVICKIKLDVWFVLFVIIVSK